MSEAEISLKMIMIALGKEYRHTKPPPLPTDLHSSCLCGAHFRCACTGEGKNAVLQNALATQGDERLQESSNVVGGESQRAPQNFTRHSPAANEVEKQVTGRDVGDGGRGEACASAAKGDGRKDKEWIEDDVCDISGDGRVERALGVE